MGVLEADLTMFGGVWRAEHHHPVNVVYFVTCDELASLDAVTSVEIVVGESNACLSLNLSEMEGPCERHLALETGQLSTA